ncbi:MAG: Hsp20/alpha crystallin family protein [Desulfobacteraceae bacterium]|jgi:HSP20 family molecular chaperone IbpA|nr:Hsp20/alpha crystallin family protein [Desulfobacteraceae bacterium]
MNGSDSKELKVREKQELSSQTEQTRPGPVFTPDVDIFETEKEIVLLADMPGVRAEDLTIDLRDDVLTLTGEVQEQANDQEQALMMEFGVGKFYRQFTLGEVINQGAIDANLQGGVLRLTLPKVEKATPRRITVKSA